MPEPIAYQTLMQYLESTGWQFLAVQLGLFTMYTKSGQRVLVERLGDGYEVWYPSRQMAHERVFRELESQAANPGKPTVVIEIEGGVLTSVRSTEPFIDVVLVDQDNIQAGDPEPRVPAAAIHPLY